MFGIGETELVIIVVFAFMLFGPDKLPGMGRTLGRVLRQFREASDGFTEVVQTNIMDPASEELEKSPKQRRREELERTGAAEGEGGEASQESAKQDEPRRETFAERRARLAAERAAREKAAAEAADGDARSADADATTSDESVSSNSNDAPTAAVDLYAMAGTQRSKRFSVAEEQEGDDGSVAESDGTSLDDANAPVTSDGEGDGD